MKTLLLMVVALLMTGSAARADHISVYNDGSGTSCRLGAPGFNPNATVMHKFTVGATGSRFRLELPAGSSLFAINSAFPPYLPFQPYEGINYGQCKQGSFVVGTIVAIYTSGEVWVRPADGYSSVIALDCASAEQDATCGGGIVGGVPDPDYYCPSCQIVPTDQKTWGAVKSLYRE